MNSITTTYKKKTAKISKNKVDLLSKIEEAGLDRVVKVLESATELYESYQNTSLIDEQKVCKDVITVLVDLLGFKETSRPIMANKASINVLNATDFSAVLDHEKRSEFYANDLPELVMSDIQAKNVPEKGLLFNRVMELDARFNLYKPEILSKIIIILYQYMETDEDPAARRYAKLFDEFLASQTETPISKLMSAIQKTLKQRYKVSSV